MVQIIKCFCCGDSVAGTQTFLFGNPESPICTICRHMSLSFIYSCGIPMTTDHWLINELVENTPMAGRGFWRYYNSVTREGEDVFRALTSDS